MSDRESLAVQRWDEEYRTGKYSGEEPVPFLRDILSTLEAEGLQGGAGLYVGCGNGRNYMPLVDAGLNLTGLDISSEAINQIKEQRPMATESLVVGDFLSYETGHSLNYLVSIQVFQHGSQAEISQYFSKSAALLEPGGLLFLRVNSTATEIFHDYDVTELTSGGGKTVKYKNGPKEGLLIHFFTVEELAALTEDNFDILLAPYEAVMKRKPPKTGDWVQWEAIFKRK